MTRPFALRAALPALLCALVGASPPARAEDCTKAYKLRGGQWIDPETGAPPCDADAIPAADVLWLLQREGRATEAVSALELAKQEMAAERDLHKADVERERAPRPERRHFTDTPWFGAGVTAAVLTTIVR